MGLQSASNEVLTVIRRGHTAAHFSDAVYKLAKLDIEVVAHVVLGLPGSSHESMMNTADFLAHLPVKGIKIHQLMIIENTQLASMYRKKLVDVFSLDEYAILVADFISRLRPDQHIHRLLADSQLERGLIAPVWAAEKLKSLSVINNYIDTHHIDQGQLFTSNN